MLNKAMGAGLCGFRIFMLPESEIRDKVKASTAVILCKSAHMRSFIIRAKLTFQMHID